MGFINNIFNAALYRPLFNVLIALYQYVPGRDFGIAVILLTILIKFLLYPLGTWSIKSQKALAEIQPKLKEIQEKFKEDKEKQTKAIMELYKQAKVSPFSGCLPILIQFPILIALYRLFWQGLNPAQFSSLLYGFMPKITSLNTYFLGIFDLSKSGYMEVEGVRHYLWFNIILIFLTGAVQFLQTRMLLPKPSKNKKQKDGLSDVMQKQMQYVMPVFIILILFSLPSAVALYWLTSSLFSIIQQKIVFKGKLYGFDK